MLPTPLTGWDGKMFGGEVNLCFLIHAWGAEGRVWSDAEGGLAKVARPVIVPPP